jgi:hypothetical protein
MKIRQGTKNPHNLYAMRGEEPDPGNDVSIGYIRFPHIAAEIVRLVNAQPGGVVRTQSFVTDADWQRAEELRTERLGPGEDDIPQVKDPERPSTTLP